MADTGRIRAKAITGKEQAGKRLDQAAAELFGTHSRARLQKWIRGGELLVDGRAQKPTFRVSGGETLVIEGLPGYDELKADGIGKWLN